VSSCASKWLPINTAATTKIFFFILKFFVTASGKMRDINACAFTSFAFHPKAEMFLSRLLSGRSGRSSGLAITEHLPIDEPIFHQQWHEDSAL
jgi:hypothetical protein